MYVFIWYPPQRSTKLNVFRDIVGYFHPHSSWWLRQGRSLEGESALNHRNHFGIIFDSGICPESSESIGNRFWFGESALNHRFGIIFDSGPDPRSKIPGRSSQWILDPVLARIIRIILESFLIRAGIQDQRSKIPGRDSWAILDFGSWIPVRVKNDSKMIRASSVSKIQ